MRRRICQNCGNEIEMNTVYCPYCCTKQPEAVTQETTKPRRRKDLVRTIEPNEDLSVPIEVKNADKPQRKQDKEEKKEAESNPKEAQNPKTESPEEKSEDAAVLQEENEELQKIAFYDELTGLKNRQALKKDKENMSRKDLAVFSIDANNLKTANDTMGHAFGNVYLKGIADSLTEVFGPNVYRNGGDEFLVFADGIGPVIAEDKIEQFKSLLEEYAQMQENNFDMVAAVGVAFGDGIKTINELIEDADASMYENKRALKDKQEKTKSNTSDNFHMSTYDPNHDGYYDDVKAKYEVKKAEYDKENITQIIKIIAVVVALFIITSLFT